MKNTFSFQSICPQAPITGNPYHHHPYHHELSLLVFTIIIFFKHNSKVQFLPIKTSWQSFHRLPWNFSHGLDSRARRLGYGKSSCSDIARERKTPMHPLPPPFKCNFSLRGFERPEDPFHSHLRRLCRDETNFLRGASSGRSNIVVVARTMNSSVSSYSGAK